MILLASSCEFIKSFLYDVLGDGVGDEVVEGFSARCPLADVRGRQIMMDNSDKTWSTGEGNGKPLQFSCLDNPMNSMKRQKVRTLKDEPLQVGRGQICYWRRTEK